MCGIAGFFNNFDLKLDDLKNMTNVIAHRGPDGEGFYFDEILGTGLGHRRLAIIDLTEHAHQPMTYQNSGYWIIYNGEIYNYLEIKKELQSLGYTFQTQSDTEVLLAAYCAWGNEGFKKLNGMFAFAIYNKRNHSILLCRDRYGVKPLYYWLQNNILIFGSELKVFASVAKKIKLSWDKKAIKTNLKYNLSLTGSGFTLFENVKSLRPGHFLFMDTHHFQITQWWNTVDHLITTPKRFKDQIEEFTAIFNDACRIRMRSDVQIGTSLSGGLDSGSIASTLSRSGYNIKVFNHLFENKWLDERDYVKLIIEKHNLNCSYVSHDPTQLQKEVDLALYHAEDFPTSLLPSSASRIFAAQSDANIKVSIDGHGADEMLGGYYWFLGAARKDSSLFSPRFYHCLTQQKKMGGAVPRHFYLKEILAKCKLKTATPTSSNSPFFTIKFDDIYTFQKQVFPKDWSNLQKLLFESFHYSILPLTLKSFDLSSMSRGVEIRMPFLDYRLVSFCFSLPDTSKINKGYSKLILREAMKNILPEKVRTLKSKIPFSNLPVKNLLQKDMRNWIENVLEEQNPLEDIINAKALKEFYYQVILTPNYNGEHSGMFCSSLNAMRLVNLFQRRFQF